MDYTDEIFSDCEVELDENRFFGCTFKNVVLNYNGGPVTIGNCELLGYSYNIGGDLLRGLEVLRALAHDDGPRAVKRLVDDISAMLRRKNPVQTFIIN